MFSKVVCCGGDVVSLSSLYYPVSGIREHCPPLCWIYCDERQLFPILSSLFLFVDVLVRAFITMKRHHDYSNSQEENI